MRCPKCGYISFDGLEKCRKCSKKIKLKEELYGTVFAASGVNFLVTDALMGDSKAQEMMGLGSEVEGFADSSASEPNVNIGSLADSVAVNPADIDVPDDDEFAASSSMAEMGAAGSTPADEDKSHLLDSLSAHDVDISKPVSAVEETVSGVVADTGTALDDFDFDLGDLDLDKK